MATHANSISAPLSSLFRDPVLRRAFERAERDLGQAFTIPKPEPKPVLTGGAAVVREVAYA